MCYSVAKEPKSPTLVYLPLDLCSDFFSLFFLPAFALESHEKKKQTLSTRKGNIEGDNMNYPAP